MNRTLAEILATALEANCGHCWARPGDMCDLNGVHVARLGRAMRRGLITGTELTAVLAALPAFTNATLVVPEAEAVAS